MMKLKNIKVIFTSFLFLFSIIFFSSKVSAAAPPTPTPQDKSSSAYSLVCMKMDTTYKPMCHPEYPNSCTPFPAGVAHPDPAHPDFEGRITATGYPTDVDIYIVGCVSTADNFKCTTGSPALDQKVRAIGFQLQAEPGHEFAVSGPNPRRAKADGSLDVIVRSKPQPIAGFDAWHAPMAYYGIYALPADVKTGNASTLQYGTFDFNQDASKCVSIHWDPEGRVFDSKSLEPLPNSTIQLLNDKKLLATGIPGVDPQITTGDSGAFSFYVPDGTYYMNPTHPGYTFPVSASALNQNYRKIYSCDRSQLNNYLIYNQQYPIVEKKGVIHCDIPLDPGTNAPRQTSPVLLSYGYNVVPRTTITIFTGTTSLPLTIVELVGEESGKTFAKTTADKIGGWQIIMNNRDVPTTEALTVRLTRPNYNSLKTENNSALKFFSAIFDRLLSKLAVYAQLTPTPNVRFEPILRYIEGYAYDSTGKIAPNAKVKVVLQMSGRVEYQTSADENGFFKIETVNLPIFAYYLQIQTANGSSGYKMTTSDFVRRNKTYLDANKLNLLTATKNGEVIGGIISPTVSINNQNQKESDAINKTNMKAANQQNSNAQTAVFLILLVLFVAAAAIGIYYYRKNKNTVPPTIN